MLIEVSPQAQQYVNQQVALGRYSSAADLIDAAVVALREREQERDELREMLRPSLDEANRGQTVPANAERIKALGRKLLASIKDDA